MSIFWPCIYSWEDNHSHQKNEDRKANMRLVDFRCSEMNITPIPILPLPYYHHYQDICKVGDNLSCGYFGVSRIVLPFFTYWFSLPTPYCMHLFGCDIGGTHPLPSPALRCLWNSENDVRLGCLSPRWKTEGWHRYRSRWHCTLGIIFSDKPGLGLRILAFACYSHSYQNITMKIRYFCRKGFKDFFPRDLKLYVFKHLRLLLYAYNMFALLTFFYQVKFCIWRFFLFVFIFLWIPLNVLRQRHIRKLHLSL